MGKVIVPYEMVFRAVGEQKIDTIARSLLASEALIQIAVGLIEDAVPGLTITSANVRFKSLSANSPLTEKLSIELFHSFQQEFEKSVPVIIEAISGHQLDPKYHGLVSTTVLIISLFGIKLAYDRWKDSKGGDPTKAGTGNQTIINNYGTLLQAGGDIIGSTPDVLRHTIENKFNDSQNAVIAKKALDFISPVKSAGGGEIRSGNGSILTETINEAPTDLEFDSVDNDEVQVPHWKCVVRIHAKDIDRNKTGWAGHLPGIWEKRLKMQLFPHIDPKLLFGRESIEADIVLVTRRKGLELRPYLFHVVRVYDAA